MFRATLILLLSALSQSLLAFEVSNNAWPGATATFYVGIPGSAPSGESWNTAFKRAMNEWTNATNFDFVAIDDGRDPCTGQNTNALGDTVSGVGFADTQCGTEFGRNVLAITLSTLSCTNPGCTGPKNIIETDIVFNANENWDIYSGPLQPQSSEFERVALHELGHALGLDHESSAIAIMQPFAGDIRSLQADDINGANFIYGGILSTPSIYEIPIKLPAKTSFSGPNDLISFAGNLAAVDASLDASYIDIYQVTFDNDSEVSLALSSTQFDPSLILARVASTQQLIPESVFTDENADGDSVATLQQQVQAGTYWIGVTSVKAAATGSYELTVNSTTSSPALSFETYTSIYGIDVEVNPNPLIKGALRSSDQRFENRYIDIYQFEVVETVNLRIDSSSTLVDTVLLVVDVLPDQQLGSVLLENDDFGFSTNSRIEATLQPGTYWLGVTSFSSNDFGDYEVQTSVILP